MITLHTSVLIFPEGNPQYGGACRTAMAETTEVLLRTLFQEIYLNAMEKYYHIYTSEMQQCLEAMRFYSIRITLKQLLIIPPIKIVEK